MAKVLLVQGLGYGDEGKGSVVDYLVRQEQAPLVVRFNGGAQAAHNVVTDDGRHHTFSQFGSGTFAGARTFLSRFMLFNPMTLLSEAKHLEEVGVSDPLSLITVEKRALVTSPFHMAVNRVREILRSGGRHGSCGMGIGETMKQSLLHPEETVYALDLDRPEVCRWKLQSYRKKAIEELSPAVFECQKAGYAKQLATEWEMINDVKFVDEVVEKYVEIHKRIEIVGPAWLQGQLDKPDSTVVFEGAQGVLLDQDYGWAPHNTWSDCTFRNADKLLAVTHTTATRIGVLRGYMTRHGAGPLVTECKTCKPAKGEHNSEGPWQQNFRLGHFDPIALRYALQVIGGGGVDQLALTCLDHLQTGIKSCLAYTSSNSLARYESIPIHHVDDENDDALHSKQQHRQEEVGKTLAFMQPVYEILPDVDAHIAHVEKELRTPVKLCSFGPKASDKRPR